MDVSARARLQHSCDAAPRWVPVVRVRAPMLYILVIITSRLQLAAANSERLSHATHRGLELSLHPYASDEIIDNEDTRIRSDEDGVQSPSRMMRREAVQPASSVIELLPEGDDDENSHAELAEDDISEDIDEDIDSAEDIETVPPDDAPKENASAKTSKGRRRYVATAGDLGVKACLVGSVPIRDPKDCLLASNFLGYMYNAKLNSNVGVGPKPVCICQDCEEVKPAPNKIKSMVTADFNRKSRMLCKMMDKVDGYVPVGSGYCRDGLGLEFGTQTLSDECLDLKTCAALSETGPGFSWSPHPAESGECKTAGKPRCQIFKRKAGFQKSTFAKTVSPWPLHKEYDCYRPSQDTLEGVYGISGFHYIGKGHCRMGLIKYLEIKTKDDCAKACVESGRCLYFSVSDRWCNMYDKTAGTPPDHCPHNLGFLTYDLYLLSPKVGAHSVAGYAHAGKGWCKTGYDAGGVSHANLKGCSSRCNQESNCKYFQLTVERRCMLCSAVCKAKELGCKHLGGPSSWLYQSLGITTTTIVGKTTTTTTKTAFVNASKRNATKQKEGKKVNKSASNSTKSNKSATEDKSDTEEDETSGTQTTKKKTKKSGSLLLIGGGVIVIAGLAGAGAFVYQKQQQKKQEQYYGDYGYGEEYGEESYGAPGAGGAGGASFQVGDQVQAQADDGVWQDASISSTSMLAEHGAYGVTFADGNILNLPAASVRPKEAQAAEAASAAPQGTPDAAGGAPDAAGGAPPGTSAAGGANPVAGQL